MYKLILVAVMGSLKILIEHGYTEDALEVIEKVLQAARKK